MPYYPPASSGSGTPGGSNTQVQYNSTGTFAGDAGMTYTVGSGTLAVTNATVGTLGGLIKGTAGALSAATGNVDYHSYPAPGTMILTDEFIGGGATSGAIGQLQWLTNATGGTLTSQAGNSAIAGHPGYIQINSGATSANFICVYLDAINVNDINTISFIYRPTDNTLVRHSIGMGNTVNAAATSSIYAEFDTASSDTNWMVAVTGGSTPGRTSTGVAFAASVWVRIDFTRTASNTWTVAVTRLDTSATGNVASLNYAAGTNNNIQWVCKTNTAATKAGLLDWFRLNLDGLSRT